MRSAETEADNEVADDDERPSSPPDGQNEFTDDDGTVYKWDKQLRAWVPQVSLTFVNFDHFLISCLFMECYDL